MIPAARCPDANFGLSHADPVDRLSGPGAPPQLFDSLLNVGWGIIKAGIDLTSAVNIDNYGAAFAYPPAYYRPCVTFIHNPFFPSWLRTSLQRVK